MTKEDYRAHWKCAKDKEDFGHYIAGIKLGYISHSMPSKLPFSSTMD
jgi:hypothetical protein